MTIRLTNPVYVDAALYTEGPYSNPEPTPTPPPSGPTTLGPMTFDVAAGTPLPPSPPPAKTYRGAGLFHDPYSNTPTQHP